MNESHVVPKSIFMTVDEVAKELGVSKSYAYKIIRAMNKKLEKSGYMTLTGRIDRRFFYEQFYCTKDMNERKDT